MTSASPPAQLSFVQKVGARGGCCSPGPYLTWSQHVGRGRRLDVHSALLVCMYIMTYPENPGEEFPSDTWLKALTRGLDQAGTQGEDVDGGGSLPSVARAGLQGLPGWLPPPPAHDLVAGGHLCVQRLSLRKLGSVETGCQALKRLLLVTVCFGQNLLPSALVQVLFVYTILRRDFPSFLLLLISCSS